MSEVIGPVIEPAKVLPPEQPCPTCDDEGWDGGCCECPDCGLL